MVGWRVSGKRLPTYLLVRFDAVLSYLHEARSIMITMKGGGVLVSSFWVYVCSGGSALTLGGGGGALGIQQTRGVYAWSECQPVFYRTGRIYRL
jgi:hypothetical protein